MPDPRLYRAETLEAGATVALDEAAMRRLTLVLRLKPGASVRVFNARDGEWRARLMEHGKRGATLAVETHLRAPRLGPDLELCFAPVKRDATDLIVEKATELGVRRLTPTITARTIAETVRLDRLAAIAQSAAEQTERFDLPEIAAPTPLARALDNWDPARRLIYADEQGDEGEAAPWGGDAGRAAPIASVVSTLSTEKLALLIGPEGGFTPEERRLLRAASFVTPVSLGPRILRAETACIAALAVLQAAWGDWR